MGAYLFLITRIRTLFLARRNITSGFCSDLFRDSTIFHSSDALCGGLLPTHFFGFVPTSNLWYDAEIFALIPNYALWNVFHSFSQIFFKGNWQILFVFDAPGKTTYVKNDPCFSNLLTSDVMHKRTVQLLWHSTGTLPETPIGKKYIAVFLFMISVRPTLCLFVLFLDIYVLAVPECYQRHYSYYK